MLTRIIKKPLFLIPAIMMAAIGLVSTLAWVALRPINKKNGFNRKFIATQITMLHVEKKDQMVISVAGVTNTSIYFETKDPSKLWVTDQDLQNGKFISLNVPNNQRITSAFSTIVDSPLVHIMVGNIPAVIKTNLDHRGASSIKKFPSAIFTRSVVIGASSYVFRGFDTTEKKAGQIFIKGNPENGELVRDKNIAGNINDPTGLITDGYLNYDKQTNKLIYTSFFSNRFYCLDTNLHLIYEGHTIDTVTTYQVEAGRAGNMITNISPSRLINGKSRIANGKLYNASKLAADNEDNSRLGSNTVIDIYNINTGNYQGSFYIPFYKRQKVSNFKMTHDRIIVFYKNYLVIYKLP